MFAYILVLVFALIIYLVFSAKYAHWKNRNVPYEKPTFFFGSIRKVLTMHSNMSDICNDLYRKYEKYRYVGFFNMWTPAIVVRDPEIMKEVLIKQFKSYRNWIQVPHNVDGALSLNPFVLHNEEWKQVRSNLSSQFTSAKVKKMLPNMLLIGSKMIKYVKDQLKGSSDAMNVSDLTKRFTGEVVFNCGYGLDARSFIDKQPYPLKIADQICSNSMMVQIKQTIGVIFPNIANIMKYTFVGDPIESDFKGTLLAVLRCREDETITTNNFLEKINGLRSKGVPYFTTDDQLICHAYTFFMDGVETSALAFAYALFELARNPHVQEKAKHEIECVVQRHNDEITYEAFQEMQYVESIILETLRLYPVISLIGRVCLEDVTLPSPNFGADGESVTISKGTQLFMPLIAFSEDATNFSDPTVFNPDRFQNSAQSLHFMGFGDGPKTCLGKSFALAQIKIGLIAILSNFTVELAKDMAIPLKAENLHIFHSPESDILLNFVDRL
ncbi:hypothetical protein RI129_001927 [Pyrocoelia pectoralis]|uniref:Cytochrome P450 n=1 Tax=Pyrocoelia pectoralis TaxID=417401 RepID=A0AAN7VX94_9COLE